MGQKVNPTGLRLGINRTWDSRWYAGKKEYGKLLQEDIKIREYLSDKLKAAGVSSVPTRSAASPSIRPVRAW
jgi:small subunit ribosomal protein S3